MMIKFGESRMKKKQEEEPRGGRTTTKSVPMESKKPTGTSNAVRGREQQGQVFSETMAA